MKKQAVLIAALLLALLFSLHQNIESVSAEGIVIGDCDGSGSIDSSDIAAAREHLYDNDDIYPSACDADQNSALTAADLHCIRRLGAAQQCTPLNWDAPLGSNLNGIEYYSPEYSFVNAFKHADEWNTRQSWSGGWGPDYSDQLLLDANGYPTELPDPIDCADYYCWVVTVLFKDIDGKFPSGIYTVLYEGEGTLLYNGGGDGVGGNNIAVVNREPGKDVIDVTATNFGIEINLYVTDPNATGDYLRNIRVLMPGFDESNEDKHIFHPEFLDSIAPYKTLRFMDWMRTNHSTQGERQLGAQETINGSIVNRSPVDAPRIRPAMDDAVYSSDKGVPSEMMIELANLVNSDPWFNMPHQATDAYVTDFATTVFDQLEPTQRVYVEYSNEIWNTVFGQHFWIRAQGDAEYSDITASSQEKMFTWYGARTDEICAIWKSVFGSESERVVCVIGSQAADGGAVWVVERMLDCPILPAGSCGQHVDALAIAPYFGNLLSSQDSILLNWLEDGQPAALDKLFLEITVGGQVSVTSEALLDRAQGHMSNYASLATVRTLPLLAYEGGQHFVNPNQQITDLFAAANNDLWMATVYDAYLSMWYAAGGKQFLHFNSMSKYDRSGNWGAWEYYGDVTAPKRDALLAYSDANPCDWQDCTGIETLISAEINLPSMLAIDGTNNVPVNLTSNAYAVTEVAFALDYDTAQLSYEGVALASGLSADFVLNATHDNGTIQVTVYPKAEAARLLPDGHLLIASFTQAGSAAGQGVRFVDPQAGHGPTKQPTSCGNDFGQAIACDSTGETLTNSLPTAVGVREQSTAYNRQLIGLAVLMFVGLTVWFVFGRKQQL